MHLYMRPMACSLAAHIAVAETGLPVTLHYVSDSQRTDDGLDYLTIAPNAYVPALQLADGTVLNEGASVLQWLADQKPEIGLAPQWGTFERYELIDALNYMATEIHQKIFSHLVSKRSSDEAKERARALLMPTLDAIARRLGDREVLVGSSFTVADAYLITLLNWFRHVGTDLARWPKVQAYHKRHLARPSVARAIAEEMDVFRRKAG
jgi:glutathione S-transferase